MSGEGSGRVPVPDAPGSREAALADLDSLLAALEGAGPRPVAEGEGPAPGESSEVAQLLRRLREDLAVLRMGLGSTQGLAHGPLPPLAVPDPMAGWSLPRAQEVAAAPPPLASPSARDLVNVHDEAFVRAAYRAILGREPDPEGMQSTLAALHGGQLAKAEILGLLRDSAEGRGVGARVPGLAAIVRWRRWRRIPVVGNVLGILQYLVRLPAIVRNLERLEIAFVRRDMALARDVNRLAAAIERGIGQRLSQSLQAPLAEIGWRVNDLQVADLERRTNIRRMASKLSEAGDSIASLRESAAQGATRAQLLEVGLAVRRAIDLLAQSHEGLAAEARGRMASLVAWEGLDAAVRAAADAAAQVGDRERDLAGGLRAMVAASEPVDRLRADLDRAAGEVGNLTTALHGFAYETRTQFKSLGDAERNHERRVRRILDELRGALAGRGVDAGARALQQQEGRLLEALYAELEGRFRGERAEIKARVAVYVPYLAGLAADSERFPLLDVGCGRGEWLELLGESGIRARGIDVSGDFVRECRGRGLEVLEEDALGHLRALPDASLGAVTAMHVVEHLRFGDLVAVLDEAVRALRAGGILVLETPNPENLIVGACTFWFDPTHVRPIPPALMHFLVQARGLEVVEVLRLHPYPPAERLPDGELAGRLNELLYGPRDYAIVARKAGA